MMSFTGTIRRQHNHMHKSLQRIMPATLYDVLEVSQSASHETLAEAYKRQHTRLSARISGVEGADQDTLDRLADLRQAFSILSDPEHRRRYDRQIATRQGGMSLAASKAPRLLLKPFLLAALVGMAGTCLVKLQAEHQRARLEWERIAAEAKLADLQLQREREEKKAAALADLERRRAEAMERFRQERKQARDEQLQLDGRSPLRVRS